MHRTTLPLWRRLLGFGLALVVAWVGFASHEVAWAAFEGPEGVAACPGPGQPSGSVQDHHLDDAPAQAATAQAVAGDLPLADVLPLPAAPASAAMAAVRWTPRDDAACDDAPPRVHYRPPRHG